jgi:hypothetical protein
VRLKIITPLADLSVRQLNGSRWWLVMEDYSITMYINSVLTTLFIPAGYRYDRATIWWQGFITKDQLGCIGPLIHDVFCHYHGNVPQTGAASTVLESASIFPWRTFTRPEADDIFLAVMLADKIIPWRAQVARVAVMVSPNW